MSEERKVFVSYSRADKDKVLPLVKSLEKNVGTKFWIDLDGIESTAQFLNVIRQAIKDSQVVLFMLSDNSINGEWTQREIMFAKECGKRVVPVILDGGGLRDWTELYFANVNYVDGTNKHLLEKLSKEIVGWIESEQTDSSIPFQSGSPNQPRGITIKKSLSRLFASLKTILSVIGILLAICLIIGICLPDEEEQEVENTILKDDSIANNSVINGHAYVDLGLSVKWATCNVGASSPEGFGDYYAWGETSTKSSYTEDNCETYSKDIGDIKGTDRDVAHVKWGGTWRMPTKTEFKELVDNCHWTWITQNDVNGYLITSNENGRSIFLPAAGGYNNGVLYDQLEGGGYWSSTPNGTDTSGAFYLKIDRDNPVVGWYFRSRGRPIRPVSD